MTLKSPKSYLWVIGILVCVVLFFGTAIVFQILGSDILPSRFYGSLIGVVLTAIITLLLLSGQTKSQERREKNMKVFEKKLLYYEDFMRHLRDILEDNKITKAEIKDLVFQMSYISMHVNDSKHADDVILELDALSQVFNKAENEFNFRDFVEHIFKIANILRVDLYGKDNDKLQHLDVFTSMVEYLNEKGKE